MDLEVMDTPNASSSNKIVAPAGKIEDSPIYNFINNLSPIKPVESSRVSQTINPLFLASPPSVFTSPQINSQRDARILLRHQLPEPSKPEFASDCGITATESQLTTDGSKSLALEVHVQNLKPKESAGKAPAGNMVPCNSSRRVSCVLDSCQGIPYGTRGDSEGEDNADQTAEVTSSEWDCLIADALKFESPNEENSYRTSVNPQSNTYMTVEHEMHVSTEQLGGGNGKDSLCTVLGEGMDIGDAHECITGSSASDPDNAMDCEHHFGIYRGMRRRCLVFEMGAAGRKHLKQNYGPESSSIQQPETADFSNDQSLVPMKDENQSLCHLLPGIGLHLNALASTPNNSKTGSHDSSASRRLLIGPSSSVNFQSTIGNQELHNDIPSAGTDRADLGQESAYIATEDMSHSSSKRKRRRSEPSAEAEGCKRCNCKKSKCLKLYCECFAAGVYCMELCACVDCYNKPAHEDTVLATRTQIESRNPLAFAPKVIPGSDMLSETRDYSTKTPASARHKRGCNCKKSGCLKKYCECYQSGVGCSFNCRCEGCRNAFGRKNGYLVGMEADVEDHGKDASDESFFHGTPHETLLENNFDSDTPATPKRNKRQLIQLQCSSKKKPPRASVSTINIRNVLGGKSSFKLPPNSDQHLETVKEDDISNVMHEFSSPSCVVKSLSPNGKRVSPPHSATGLRSSRKLILQSIPSFPSLTQNQ